jgi:hypothetical protein
MKLVKRVVPFIYSAVFILLLMHLFKLSYFATIMVMFYVPSVILFFYNYRWMRERKWIRPFIWANVWGGVACFYFEYVALGMGFWHFSDPSNYLPQALWLWGPKIWEIPIEEYLIYYILGPVFAILLNHIMQCGPVFELRGLPKTIPAQKVKLPK